MEKTIKAPVKTGDVVGHIIYSMDGQEIGRSELVAGENVKKAGFFDYIKKTLKELWL